MKNNNEVSNDGYYTKPSYQEGNVSARKKFKSKFSNVKYMGWGIFVDGVQVDYARTLEEAKDMIETIEYKIYL